MYTGIELYETVQLSHTVLDEAPTRPNSPSLDLRQNDPTANSSSFHLVIFDSLDGTTIHLAALHTHDLHTHRLEEIVHLISDCFNIAVQQPWIC